MGNIWTKIVTFYDANQNLTSFGLALLLMAFMLFFTTSVPLVEQPDPVTPLEFINVEEFTATKRTVQKNLSEDGEVTDQDVDRAEGTSEDAVDLTFAGDDTVRPKPIPGSINIDKYFPARAKSENVEAVASVVVYANREGQVIKVEVQNVVLLKKLPAALTKQLRAEFANTAQRAISQARFTPHIAGGQKRASIFFFDLRMQLK